MVERRYSSSHSEARHLLERSAQLHASAVLPPQKTELNWRQSVAQNCSGCHGLKTKLLPLQGMEPQLLGYQARSQVTVPTTVKWLTTSCSVKFISQPLFFVVCMRYTVLQEDEVSACSGKMRHNL
jgi:hypothetical protein